MVHETYKFLKLIGFVGYFIVHFVLNLPITKNSNLNYFIITPKNTID